MADVSFANNEDFPVVCAFMWSAENLSTVATSKQDVIDLMENPLSTGPIEISAKYDKSRVRKRMTMTMWKIIGNKLVYEASELYSCGNASGPTTPLYFSLLFYAPGGQNLTLGTTTILALNSRIKFFNRRPIADSGPLDMSPKAYNAYKKSYAERKVSAKKSDRFV